MTPDPAPASASDLAPKVGTVTTTGEELVAAFTEWDRRYREDPAGFESDVERLLRGQTAESYGAEVVPYFLELLAAVRPAPDPPPVPDPAKFATVGEALEDFEARRTYSRDELMAAGKVLAPVEPAPERRDPMAGPLPFVLVRDEDVTGVSGTGPVAEGVLFADGTVALRWLSDWPTSVVFHDRGLEAVVAVHGHDGKTRIVFTGPTS